MELHSDVGWKKAKKVSGRKWNTLKEVRDISFTTIKTGQIFNPFTAAGMYTSQFFLFSAQCSWCIIFNIFMILESPASTLKQNIWPLMPIVASHLLLQDVTLQPNFLYTLVTLCTNVKVAHKRSISSHYVIIGEVVKFSEKQILLMKALSYNIILW